MQSPSSLKTLVAGTKWRTPARSTYVVNSWCPRFAAGVGSLARVTPRFICAVLKQALSSWFCSRYETPMECLATPRQQHRLKYVFIRYKGGSNPAGKQGSTPPIVTAVFGFLGPVQARSFWIGSGRVVLDRFRSGWTGSCRVVSGGVGWCRVVSCRVVSGGAASGRVGRVGSCRAESGRVGPGRTGSGRIGPGRAGLGRVGSGRAGSGRVEPGRVGSGRVSSSRVGPGRCPNRTGLTDVDS